MKSIVSSVIGLPLTSVTVASAWLTLHPPITRRNVVLIDRGTSGAKSRRGGQVGLSTAPAANANQTAVPTRSNIRCGGFVAAATLAAVIPVGAFADSIGPHSSFYSTVSPKSRRYVPNAVDIDVHRATGVALVNVSNKCLGTFTIPPPGPGAPPITGAKNATITAHLHRGRLSFSGRANLIAGQGNAGQVRMKFTAVIAARKATGSATFPGTKCPRIRFVAPLRERTK